MQLILLRPGQIRTAAESGLPLIVASGVVEYHGPHLPVGTDYLIAASILEEVERRIPDQCVLAPGLPFGTTGSWAGGAEDGEVDLPAEAFFTYVKPILRAYLGMGFQHILVCQHHQGLEGPESLCLRRAASELALEEGYRVGGGARWGRLPQDRVPSPFNKIRVVAPASFIEGEPLRIPWGHGSYGETEYMHAVFPDNVDMAELDRIDPKPRWLKDSHTSDGTVGGGWLDKCAASWVAAIEKLARGE